MTKRKRLFPHHMEIVSSSMHQVPTPDTMLINPAPISRLDPLRYSLGHLQLHAALVLGGAHCHVTARPHLTADMQTCAPHVNTQTVHKGQEVGSATATQIPQRPP